MPREEGPGWVLVVGAAWVLAQIFSGLSMVVARVAARLARWFIRLMRRALDSEPFRLRHRRQTK